MTFKKLIKSSLIRSRNEFSTQNKFLKEIPTQTQIEKFEKMERITKYRRYFDCTEYKTEDYVANKCNI